MRKFYQLIRIDLSMILDYTQGDATPAYMPVNPLKPEFSLGYFSSKKKVLDKLIEIQPQIMRNGTMIRPFYSEYNSRGHWEGWLVHDKTFSTVHCYMILEIEAE